MRQIVLDTETTGLEPSEGHRILEIGCVELQDRRLTGNDFHCYLNPEREVDEGALAVHGLDQALLAEKPRFAEVVGDFMAYLQGADELLIHNAPFDVGFIDQELARVGGQWSHLAAYHHIVDTLVLARRKRPGQRNSLDVLCKYYQVDNSGRALHGALLDARLLAEVYLALTGGQSSLALGHADAGEAGARPRPVAAERSRLPVIAATAAELQAHAKVLEVIDKASGGRCLWSAMQASN